MYHFLSHFRQPFTLIYIILTFAIINLWRSRREGRGRLLLVTLPFLALTIDCLPVVSHLALGSLERRFAPLRERPSDATAIVVLGGNVEPTSVWRSRAEVGNDTYIRCQGAVDVYRRGDPCLVLVSGGRVDPDPSTPAVSHLMYDYLCGQGVRSGDIVVEDRSRSTYENAVESARLLKARGIRRVVLVTDATHMARARGSFRKQGVDVVPAPCNFRSLRSSLLPCDFLPDPDASLDVLDAVYEWLGLAWYRLKGRS